MRTVEAQISAGDWLKEKLGQGYTFAATGSGGWIDLIRTLTVFIGKRTNECWIAYHPEGRSAAWSRFEIGEDGEPRGEKLECHLFENGTELKEFLRDQIIVLGPQLPIEGACE